MQLTEKKTEKKLVGSWSGGMWGEALQLGKQAAFKLRGARGKGDLKSLFSRDLWFLK